LTTAKFYSPSGRPYSRVGVEPDVVVRSVEKPITTLSPVAGNELSFANDAAVSNSDESKEDAILEAGLQVARQQLARAK
jgi:C-terminal processing protease CtpA/Prc